MDFSISRVWHFALFLILLVALCKFSDGYDPLDPNGNITVTIDILQWTHDGYVARVTIQNYYQYRHVDKPGWRLGWIWAKNEVIWSMSGALATQQGNCSSYTSPIPHSCKKDPVIVDQTPDALPQNKSAYCCSGGILSAWAIDPSKSFSSFEIMVGNLGGSHTAYRPLNFTLQAPGPGYTCGPVVEADPTVSSVIGGRREEQVFRTWKSMCTYSSYVANKTPVCCLSLSTFYNPEVTSCPLCSCGCRLADRKRKTCIREGETLNPRADTDVVRCTEHMCPLQVHWHIKENYRDHWRVKLTISNYNFRSNYSNWNIVVQHPGFSQNTTTYSFNSTVLPTVGIPDEIALFWGLDFYNNELLQADEKQLGSVTTDILLSKDPDSFTLSNGWAFPRRIYFNGENCEMALPDSFPALPNASFRNKPTLIQLFTTILISLVVKALAFLF